MSAEQRRLKVFLCHAEEDKSKVRDLYQSLCVDGVEPWLDEKKLLPGQDWRVEITKAVQEADVVLICMSHVSARKEGFVQKEINFALDKALEKPEGMIYIIPARLEECVIPDKLSRWQRVDLFEKDGYENLLLALHLRATEIETTSQIKEDRVCQSLSQIGRGEKLVSDSTLTNWLSKHSLVANPFGSVDIKSNPTYPIGAARPDLWEAFLDPDSLFAHCLVYEDAQALSYLLQKECLPLGTDGAMGGVNRNIFPIRVSHQQTMPIQSPLITLSHSAAQTWLSVMSSNPDIFLKLPPTKQNALLELLYWSMRSNKAIIDVLHVNGLKDNEVSGILTRKVFNFENRFPATSIPIQTVLFSWLKINPFEASRAYLILFGDNLLLETPTWWLEQFNSLISTLFLDGIVTKVIASTPLPILISLRDITLSWSNERLKQSIDGQFESTMDVEEKKLQGKATRFHDLFGYGIMEQGTTDRLISAANHSLARLLTLGNRLLQEHCNKPVIEEYLSIDELDDILKTA